MCTPQQVNKAIASFLKSPFMFVVREYLTSWIKVRTAMSCLLSSKKFGDRSYSVLVSSLTRRNLHHM